jgi:predicted nucleic-acid-binding protein
MVASVKIAVDTNVLLRATIPVPRGDRIEAQQSSQAKALLQEASSIVVSLPALCEFAWVLQSGYKFDRAQIEIAIRALLAASKVVCDRHTAEYGLSFLAAGGDFAGGVIAEAGFLAGADRFVSFDQRAVRLVAATGRDAAIPA